MQAVQDTEYLTLNDCGYRLEEPRSTNLTGVFGFTVEQTDALDNTNKVLYKGKFTVGRQVYNPSKMADRKKQFYYYVDQDWRLPLAFASAVNGDQTHARTADLSVDRGRGHPVTC
jgi:hypothetical protein